MQAFRIMLFLSREPETCVRGFRPFSVDDFWRCHEETKVTPQVLLCKLALTHGHLQGHRVPPFPFLSAGVACTSSRAKSRGCY